MTDEQQIRDLVATWMSASRAGDVDTVLSLMTDDAVFLVPGQPPMRKADFAAASRAQQGAARPTIDGTSEVEEIVVAGDVAYLRAHLTISVTPPHGGTPMKRAGRTLTILRREHGRWLLARDANLLVAVAD
jgi:uncharacterized protein (TIGR02246 family)